MIIAVRCRTKMYLQIPEKFAPTNAQRIEAGMPPIISPRQRLENQFAAIVQKWDELGVSSKIQHQRESES